MCFFPYLFAVKLICIGQRKSWAAKVTSALFCTPKQFIFIHNCNLLWLNCRTSAQSWLSHYKRHHHHDYYYYWFVVLITNQCYLHLVPDFRYIQLCHVLKLNFFLVLTFCCLRQFVWLLFCFLSIHWNAMENKKEKTVKPLVCLLMQLKTANKESCWSCELTKCESSSIESATCLAWSTNESKGHELPKI